jgi:hypothetical protein
MNKKKKRFNEKDQFCSQCGGKLEYVCNTRNCYTFLGESSDAKCLKCQEKIKKRKEAVAEGGKKASAALSSIVSSVVETGKKAVDFVKEKIKK